MDFINEFIPFAVLFQQCKTAIKSMILFLYMNYLCLLQIVFTYYNFFSKLMIVYLLTFCSLFDASVFAKLQAKFVTKDNKE